MKEIIRYVGGGFLAVSVAVSFFYLIVTNVPEWNVASGIQKQQGAFDEVCDMAYSDAIRKEDIHIKIVSQNSLLVSGEVDLRDLFVATDANGDEEDIVIKTVRNVLTGERVLCTNGKCTFRNAGVYEVCFQCRSRIFTVRIPVNLLEEEV